MHLEELVTGFASLKELDMCSVCEQKYVDLQLSFRLGHVEKNGKISKNLLNQINEFTNHHAVVKTFFIDKRNCNGHRAILIMRDAAGTMVGLLLFDWNATSNSMTFQIRHMQIAPQYRRKKIGTTWIGLLNYQACLIMVKAPVRLEFALVVRIPKDVDVLRFFNNRMFQLIESGDDHFVLRQKFPQPFVDHTGATIEFVAPVRSSSGSV